MIHIKNLKVKSIKFIIKTHYFVIVHPSSRNSKYALDYMNSKHVNPLLEYNISKTITYKFNYSMYLEIFGNLDVSNNLIPDKIHNITN